LRKNVVRIAMGLVIVAFFLGHTLDHYRIPILERFEAIIYDARLVLVGRGRAGSDALEAGLVTFAPDEIDWDDEVRLAVEARAAFSPDVLTGLEANLRFAGPETMETKIFGRLTAWQNWIFQRPNAVGERGADRESEGRDGADPASEEAGAVVVQKSARCKARRGSRRWYRVGRLAEQ